MFNIIHCDVVSYIMVVGVLIIIVTHEWVTANVCVKCNANCYRYDIEIYMSYKVIDMNGIFERIHPIKDITPIGVLSACYVYGPRLFVRL